MSIPTDKTTDEHGVPIPGMPVTEVTTPDPDGIEDTPAEVAAVSEPDLPDGASRMESDEDVVAEEAPPEAE